MMDKNKAKEFVMGQSIETPNTFDDLNSDDLDKKPLGEDALFLVDEAEELEWLMSLALDDALDVEERSVWNPF